MLKVIILIILYSIFTSCSIDKKDYRSIKIIIEKGYSCKYDLYNRIYTVYYVDKPSAEIKFNLSEDERSKIVDKYFDLDINRITINTTIEDECRIMPDIYTKLNIETKCTTQKIEFSEGCDEFSLLNSNRANRVKKFLKFIDEILKGKAEIKNVPKSNVRYM